VSHGLVPWLIPLAMVVGVIVAASGAVWLLFVLLVVAVWGLLPLGIAGLRRSGTDLPRWMRFGPPH
jgi:hypothetical protein